jgi:hypothetical protein
MAALLPTLACDDEIVDCELEIVAAQTNSSAASQGRSTLTFIHYLQDDYSIDGQGDCDSIGHVARRDADVVPCPALRCNSSASSVV